MSLVANNTFDFKLANCQSTVINYGPCQTRKHTSTRVRFFTGFFFLYTVVIFEFEKFELLCNSEISVCSEPS